MCVVFVDASIHLNRITTVPEGSVHSLWCR